MIRLISHGSFKKTVDHLDKLMRGDMFKGIEAQAQKGVRALSGATPKRSGKTANSWTYTIERSRGGLVISWRNTNLNQRQRIALLHPYLR